MRKTNSFWLVLLLVGTLISVPEGTLTRIIGDTFSASVITMLRYVLAAVFAAPFVVLALRKHQVTARRLLLMALVAIPLSLDPLISQYVIVTTSASFQTILSLFTPIMFVIISTIATKDNISRHQIVGLFFAILGGMLMVALPNLTSATTNNYGHVPVILMFVQAICVSIQIIYWRKQNERGTPLIVILGTFYFVWAIISAILAAALGEIDQVQRVTTGSIAILAYLGLVTSIIYNVVFTDFYRYIGTTSAATMKYLKRGLAVILPMVVLGETISWPIAVGTLFIVIGVVIVHAKSQHPKVRSKTRIRKSVPRSKKIRA